MLRSKKCEQFLKHNKVDDCTMTIDDDEGNFSNSGCDCCMTGLGNIVYECEGYSREHGEVFQLGEICGDCIAYFYNGDDSDVSG